MTIGFSPRMPGRWLLFALPALVLAPGCQQSYPEDLTYPIRSDLLVVKVPPGTDIPNLDPPGELDQTLQKLADIASHPENYDPRKVEFVPKRHHLERVLTTYYGTPAAPNAETVGLFYDPRTLDAKDRRDLERVLTAIFGTPAAPRVALPSAYPGSAGVGSASAALQLDEGTLAEGSKLYRRHCLQCHGVTGDGRGPTGAWVNPHPRDYRTGKFKFISTRVGKPSRDDLVRVLQNGIEGTSMPAYNTLGKEELEALVSYVIHLSLRGEVEYKTFYSLLGKDPGARPLEPLPGGDEASIASNAQVWTALLLTRDWYEANKPEKRFQPKAPEYPTDAERADSVRRGYEAFVAKKKTEDKPEAKKGIGGCIECHRDFGRQVAYRYDAWGTLVRPNNLTAGVYRGGRRPVDLYYRLRAGISPSTMPGDDVAAEKEVWDLVNFVHALPYPAMLPPDIRDKVYGSAPPVSKE